jgi:hypothetical protein
LILLRLNAMTLSILCLMGGACLGYLIAALMAATR